MENNIKQLMNENILKECSNKFDISTLQLNKLGEYQNFIYEYKKDDKKYILRVTHSSHRLENEIEGELDWVMYLAKGGVSVAKPILSKNGNLTERVDIEDSYFTVTSFEKVKGKQLNYPEFLGNEKVFEKCGRATGKIHALSKEYKPSREDIKRHHWTENYYLKNIGRFIKQDSDEIIGSYQSLKKEIEKLPKDKDTYGLIHGDINVGNFFEDGEKINLFDFDECQYSWFVEDIAIQLYYAVYVFGDDNIEERHQQAKIFLKSFMKGYLKENILDSKDMEMLPLFLRLREIIVHAGMNRSFDIENAGQWTKDYISQSRERIVRGVALIDFETVYNK